jgi:hypothetical protein
MNKIITNIFIEFLKYKEFNEYYYSQWWEDDEIYNYPYTFISVLNWFIQEKCFNEKYEIINHADFVIHIFKIFEEIYWSNDNIDEIVIIGFIEGILDGDIDKTQRILQYFTKEKLINDIKLFYKDFFWKEIL